MTTSDDKQPGQGTPTPLPKNAKTTSGRFPGKSKGLIKSKPKGGAPLGNRNALKTGRHTSEMREWRRTVGELVRGSKALLASLDKA